MPKIYGWTKRNKKALGYAAAGIAVPFATHFLFDAKMFDGESIYSMTNSMPRFGNYLFTAGMLGRAIDVTYQGKNGRPSTFGEKLRNYGMGAVAATALAEGWENIGSTEFVNNILKQYFGDFAKQEFPGKGFASVGDAAVTIGATEAGVALKEYFSRRKETNLL